VGSGANRDRPNRQHGHSLLPCAQPVDPSPPLRPPPRPSPLHPAPGAPPSHPHHAFLLLPQLSVLPRKLWEERNNEECLVNGSFPGELLTDWEVKLKWKQEQGKRTNKKNRRKNGEPDDNEDQENDRETAVIPSPSVWNFSEISVSSLDQDGIRNHSASAALRSLSFKKNQVFRML